MNAANQSTSTPSSAAASGIEALVCDDIARRQAMGIAKYGKSVQDNPLPLRAWLAHALEENLDAAIYLRRAMQEIDLTTLTWSTACHRGVDGVCGLACVRLRWTCALHAGRGSGCARGKRLTLY